MRSIRIEEDHHKVQLCGQNLQVFCQNDRRSYENGYKKYKAKFYAESSLKKLWIFLIEKLLRESAESWCRLALLFLCSGRRISPAAIYSCSKFNLPYVCCTCAARHTRPVCYSCGVQQRKVLWLCSRANKHSRVQLVQELPEHLQKFTRFVRR